jgi:hypothetical protein
MVPVPEAALSEIDGRVERLTHAVKDVQDDSADARAMMDGFARD